MYTWEVVLAGYTTKKFDLHEQHVDPMVPSLVSWHGSSTRELLYYQRIDLRKVRQ